MIFVILLVSMEILLAHVRIRKFRKILQKKACKPKRPISAFFFFTVQNRKKIYAE